MWLKKASKTVYKTPWMEVYEDEVVDPEGKSTSYSYLHGGASSQIVAIDEIGRIYLVKQYRYPIQEWTWEIPGGGALNHDPLEVAKVELHEELGLEAKNIELIGKIQAYSGISDEWQHVFVATGLSEKKLKHETDDFLHEIIALSWEEIKVWIAEGKINDSQSLASLMLYQNLRTL